MRSKSSRLSRTSRFEAGVPADPTKNMSEEDAAEWKKMNEKYRDKFKTARSFGRLASSDRSSLIRLASSLPVGSSERRTILAGLSKVSALEYNVPGIHILDNAQVFGFAGVYGDATVSDRAKVSGRAQVFGDAEVFGRAQVYGGAKIFGRARIGGTAQILGGEWDGSEGDILSGKWLAPGVPAGDQ